MLFLLSSLLFAPAPLPAAARPAVLTGLDAWEAEGFAALKGKRVGLIANHTAVDRWGRPAADLLARAEGVTLAAIFSPEHGYSGQVEHGRTITDGVTASGVPVHSLYGSHKRPTAEMLRGLDALVFDMQDVGARFYTYITTLGYALEEAARAGIEFYVLDRPNPLGGDVVEGLPLDPSIRHFTAYYSIPSRHGFTAGEIARWHDAQAGLRSRLTVVPLRGWRRSMRWRDTGLAFIPPSPNIRTPRTALLYSGIGAFESTNVSVGRGTPHPFELFGAPWMDGEVLSRRLDALRLPGVRFRPAVFTPAKDLYAGRRCGGVRVIVTDEAAVRPLDVFIRAAGLLRELSGADFKPRWAEMPRMLGSADFQAWYESGLGAEEMLARVHRGAAEFEAARKPFLLYE